MSDVEQEIAEEMGDDAGVPDGIDPETGELLDPDAEPDAATQETQTARSQADIEAIQRKLEAEANRHAKRVAEIMGDDFAMLVPSPVDWTPGFLFNVPGMLPDDEQVAALDAILGRGVSDQLRDSEDAERCDRCDGWGVTKTHSRVPGQETKPCGKCNGSGWQTKLPPPPVQLAPAPPAPPVPPQPTTTYTVPNGDPWGRPLGHAHYGIPPAQVGT